MRPVLLGAAVLAVVTASGCKKATTTISTAPAASNAPAADGGGGGNTNYVPGGGAVQNVRQAARRTDVSNDMRQIGILIADFDTTNGRMPTKRDIEGVLQREPKILKLVQEGTIILTGNPNRGGCWAYEIEADTKGGLVLMGPGTVSRMSSGDAAAAIRQ